MDSFRLDDVLGAVVRGLRGAVPGLVGADVAVLYPSRPHHRPVVLAEHGVGGALEDVQSRVRGGPTRDAAAGGKPVVSADLWRDERWPGLDLDRACRMFPRRRAALREVRGATALPGLRDNGGLVVLTAYGNRPADDATLDVLSRYERLVASAIATVSASAGTEERTGRVLAVLHHRALVDQAKGIVMARCRTDADTAWALLHEVSARAGAEPSAVAVELVDEVVDRPCPFGARAVGEPKARRIARELWAAIGTDPGTPHRPSTPDTTVASDETASEDATDDATDDALDDATGAMAVEHA
ncbi:ANTAR domain-containing protein [Actinosynnema sp. NPDC047251]|uniref:ANTAR domain-containing protein n=1 Tax=Saccharothrix espanaensis (strain ATCC 51144 / DSM 44229 / JCM 9112 / NBRC 15066 / NRRL 15764) TaxID=1179773 RepID=K0K4B4_SACES|nr:ANTAR domain-containing protein [Saccharothrix espanaensis]CCH31694.1 hypothetical protein BN6_44130 [Saccharothrix espanaensis DSM 44229]